MKESAEKPDQLLYTLYYNYYDSPPQEHRRLPDATDAVLYDVQCAANENWDRHVLVPVQNPQLNIEGWNKLMRSARKIMRSKGYRDIIFFGIVLKGWDAVHKEAESGILHKLGISANDYRACNWEINRGIGVQPSTVLAWIKLGRPIFGDRYIWIERN